jgi:hypothetical protein
MRDLTGTVSDEYEMFVKRLNAQKEIVDKFLSLYSGLDSSDENTTEDTNPPTKLKKSSKPKSTKSQASKGSKKKVGK